MTFIYSQPFKSNKPKNFRLIFFFFWFSFFFSDLMSGLCVQKVFTWMASEPNLIAPMIHFWTTSMGQDVAIQRITPAVMETVTMKMLLFHSTTKVGVNARRMVITWPVSTKVTAMTLTVLTSSNAVNIYWEEIVEMVSFELGEELRKMFFRLVTSVG